MGLGNCRVRVIDRHLEEDGRQETGDKKTEGMSWIRELIRTPKCDASE